MDTIRSIFVFIGGFFWFFFCVFPVNIVCIVTLVIGLSMFSEQYRAVQEREKAEYEASFGPDIDPFEKRLTHVSHELEYPNWVAFAYSEETKTITPIKMSHRQGYYESEVRLDSDRGHPWLEAVPIRVTIKNMPDWKYKAIIHLTSIDDIR